jgi:hypothetical protein
MAKKALLKDHDNVEILPITRGELVLDSSGNEALHSDEFLATNSWPGLMSGEDKTHVDYLKKNSTDGTIDKSDWVLTKNDGAIGWYKLPQQIFGEDPQLYNPTSISLNKDWKASGFLLDVVNGFSNGLYLIKITSGNLIFSGITSVYVGKITVEDEIVLHMSGIPQVYSDGTQGRIYAKIAPSLDADYGEIYLATNVPQSAITNLSITMKKLL